MSDVVRARLIASGLGHNGHVAPGDENVKGRERLPEFLEVFIPPVLADGNWTCGTKWAWKVAIGELSSRGLRSTNYYVCEHMIEVTAELRSPILVRVKRRIQL